MILLVVDTQKALVNKKLYAYDKFVSNVKLLIEEARNNNIEVIYVVHDDGVGSDLEVGTTGFEIFEEFAPRNNEKQFVKTVNSAFKDTGLLDYLEQKKEKDIIVVGLQTDMCINATVIAGFEHGFRILIPAFCNTTIDNAYMNGEQSYQYFNEFLWKDRFGRCISVAETIKIMAR